MKILIRHAESEANAGLPTTSPGGIALTELGLLQADELAKSWLNRPGRILSSPFLRAKQTAKPLAQKFQLSVEAAAVEEFTYLSPARCAGTVAAERRTWVLAYWDLSDPDHRDGPGAETFREFVGRVRLFLEMTDLAGGDVIVFCHGQFMQMVRWLQKDPLRLIDHEAMRHFRSVDLEQPIAHCEQYHLD